jgi:3-oxoacyl-[acyl-carrier-protein] synthase III
MDQITQAVEKIASFFDRPGVQMDVIKAGKNIPFGIERVFNPLLKIGGVYGTWGESFDNNRLPSLLEERLGKPLAPEQRLSLADLGFTNRHHIAKLSPEDDLAVEVEIGARLLKEAIRTCGWEASEVEGVLIGMSAPTGDDYIPQICKLAGIPDSALKVAVHKACDSSVGCLHLALNPDMPENKSLNLNIAKTLYGKKVLVGGIEGLSRFIGTSHDPNALQMFGNGAGVIGVIPGVTMKFIVGKTFENYDEDGFLQVQMYYPHAGIKSDGSSMLDVVQTRNDMIRVAGMMHEPADGSSVIMAGPMGMVKLFVRTGVKVVEEVYAAYQAKLAELGMQGKSISVAIVHHANYKINKLKEKQLNSEGIVMAMPWLLSEFGNISAASNMIAFLRQLPQMNISDHVLIDGFGAGTYYDVLAVEMGS